MLEIKSTVIQSVDYDQDGGNLTLRFTNGSLYVYHDVYPETVCELLFSNSVGQAFQDLIKDKFDYERVE